MPALLDITGRQYGRLTVIAASGERDSDGNVRWLCHCICGNDVLVSGHGLRRGQSRSCGCLQREAVAATGRRNHGTPVKHGHSRLHGVSATYRSWRAARNRCLLPSNTSYPYYGARGVQFCDRWTEFTNFLADMGERPAGKTIDRIDPAGNYEPGNCRWASRAEQDANRRVR